MKRLTFLLLVLVFAVACDDDNATGPTNLPLVFRAPLLPANEVPPVVNVESPGHGSVQVTFDVTRNASGAITAATAMFYFQLTDYPTSPTIIGAHIHPGAAGVNGPVIISTGLSNTNTRTLANGLIEFTSPTVAVDPALMQQIINNPSAFYFNVHSPLNPGGFSRGQLERIQ
jgi:hypothetical protein